MSHKRIPIVCLVLSALMASAFIATQLSSGQAPPKDAPLKMKVLRDKAHVKNSPGQSEIAAFKKTLPQEDERQLEDKIPKHVPIKIKINKEKEAGFKDLKNEKWAREFELEVTNTGTKPIYSLYFHVMTDVKAAAGFQIMFPLYYGSRDELGDITTKADPTDVPIKPGETVSLKIHPSMLDAWDYKRKSENRPLPKHLEVKLQFLSFGDGTGFVGSGATPLPRTIPEGEGSAACLPLSRSDVFGWDKAPPGSPLWKMLSFNLPATIWPVNFSPDSVLEINRSGASLFDTCCPGVNCSMLTRSFDRTCVNCPLQTRVGLAICSNPTAACLEATFGSFECFSPKSEVEPFACQTIDLNPCGTHTPSPSPTPTPSPSPTPTHTPCPYALPSECPGGVPRDPCTNPDPPPAPGATPNTNPDGCPFGYRFNNGACCVPIACPQPTPTPPSCGEGEASIFSGPPICQWSDCFTLLPNPSPSPTSESPEYKHDCVDYYWVWYVSYDGGKTWEQTGQFDYAGCFAN